MLKELIPARATRVIVYLAPISMRWGPAKLRKICSAEIGIDPEPTTAFLFVNKSRDRLLLYSVDETGDQTVVKKLDKGAFLLPAPELQGKPFVIMRPSILPRMFR